MVSVQPSSPWLYRNRALIAYGNFVFRYRNKVFPIFLVVMFVALPGRWLAEGTPKELYSDIAAMALGFLGEAIRIATVGLDYIKRGGLNKRVYADKLVDTGMFGHCRNPLYVGNIIMAIGLLVLFENPWAFAIGTVFTFVTYIAIVAAEEKYLHVNFGTDYEAYCANVNRWLPKLDGLAETFGGATFNWQRVLLKEMSSFLGWMIAAVAIEVLTSVVEGSPVFNASDLIVFGIPFAAVVASFIAGRILKKTGSPLVRN